MAAGEEAVRQGDVDVLVVDARGSSGEARPTSSSAPSSPAPSSWSPCTSGRPPPGISPDDLLALVAPVPVENVELGAVAGPQPRRRDGRLRHDRPAARRHQHLREHGADRRRRGEGQPRRRGAAGPDARPAPCWPARSPASACSGSPSSRVTALAALVAMAAVDSVDVPAVRGACWPGSSCGSCSATPSTPRCTARSARSRRGPRTRQSVAGPVSRRADRRLLGLVRRHRAARQRCVASVVSLFPLTAPFAMPGRIAHGRGRVVGTAARRRPHAGRDRRPRAVRRAGLHRSHPPQPARRSGCATPGAARRLRTAQERSHAPLPLGCSGWHGRRRFTGADRLMARSTPLRARCVLSTISYRPDMPADCMKGE